MKGLIQRVKHAQVEVENEIIAKIDFGILLFLAFEKEDDQAKAEKLLQKILNYRIFVDPDFKEKKIEPKLDFSLKQVEAELLIVSQFTLAATTSKGLRPSFSTAMEPLQAEKMYYQFIELVKREYPKIQTGKFGANMQVTLQNDGPLTFLLQV